MAYCGKCWVEYREGVQRCPDCGAQLSPGPLPRPQPPKKSPPRSELVRLCQVDDRMDVHVVKAALAAVGISCVVSEHDSAVLWLDHRPVAESAVSADILVPRSRFADAQQVLLDIHPASFEWPEKLEPEI